MLIPGIRLVDRALLQLGCLDILLWRLLDSGAFCLQAVMGKSVGRQALIRGQQGFHFRIKKQRRSMARNGPDLRCSVAAGNGIERDLQNTRDGIDITTQGSCFDLYHYASLVSTLYYALVSITNTVPKID